MLWTALPQARHYLYPVHPSQSLLCSSTLASSLYLLLLTLAHRRYDDTPSRLSRLPAARRPLFTPRAVSRCDDRMVPRRFQEGSSSHLAL